MTDISRTPGYKIADLPQDYQTLIQQKDLDDGNGYINEKDLKTIEAFAKDQSESRTRQKAENLVGVAQGKDLPRDPMLSNKIKGVNDGKSDQIEKLANDPNALKSLTLDERVKFMIGIMNDWSVSSGEESAVKKILLATPEHQRAALLAKLENTAMTGQTSSRPVASELTSEIDEFANLNAIKAWLREAEVERPDLGAASRAVAIKNAIGNGSDVSYKVTRLVLSAPEDSVTGLVKELNGKGLLDDVMAKVEGDKKNQVRSEFIVGAMALDSPASSASALIQIGGYSGDLGVELIERAASQGASGLESFMTSGLLKRLVSEAGSGGSKIQAAVVAKLAKLEPQKAARALFDMGGYNLATAKPIIDALSGRSIELFANDVPMLKAFVTNAAAASRGDVQRYLIDKVMDGEDPLRTAKALGAIGGFGKNEVAAVLDRAGRSERTAAKLANSPEALVLARADNACRQQVIDFVIGIPDSATIAAVIPKLSDGNINLASIRFVLEAVETKHGNDTAEAVAARWNNAGVLRPFTSFVEWQPPNDLKQLARLAYDPDARRTEFRSDNAKWSELSTALPGGPTKDSFQTKFDSSRAADHILSHFNTGLVGFVDRELSELKDIPLDDAMWRGLVDAAENGYGSITHQEIKNLREKHLDSDAVKTSAFLENQYGGALRVYNPGERKAVLHALNHDKIKFKDVGALVEAIDIAATEAMRVDSDLINALVHKAEGTPKGKLSEGTLREVVFQHLERDAFSSGNLRRDYDSGKLLPLSDRKRAAVLGALDRGLIVDTGAQTLAKNLVRGVSPSDLEFDTTTSNAGGSTTTRGTDEGSSRTSRGTDEGGNVSTTRGTESAGGSSQINTRLFAALTEKAKRSGSGDTLFKGGIGSDELKSVLSRYEITGRLGESDKATLKSIKAEELFSSKALTQANSLINGATVESVFGGGGGGSSSGGTSRDNG